MRYLVDHWRGRHSLGRSFWLNGLAANLAAVAVITVMTLVVAGFAKDSPPAMLAGVGGMWAAALAITLWQVVGTWRSAENHPRLGGRVLWARAAKLVLLVMMIHGGVVAYKGAQQVNHLAKLALGRDGLWTEVRAEADAVTITGFVTFETPVRLAALLAGDVAPRLVRFDSPGGYVGPAKSLRETIEARGLDTEALGRCESACTLAFIGGATRRARPDTRFGFHGFTLPGVDRADIAGEEDLVQRSWLERGVADTFVRHAFAAAGGEMWHPSLRELVDGNFVTHIVVDGKVMAAGQYCQAHDCR